MGFRAGLDAVAKRKISSTYRESNPVYATLNTGSFFNNWRALSHCAFRLASLQFKSCTLFNYQCILLSFFPH
jgi:hypothetical protein